MIQALLAFLLLAANPGAPSLPQPSGKYPVGTTEMWSGSESIVIWYPASKGGKPAEYASAETVRKLTESSYYGQAADTIGSWAKVQTHSSNDAQNRPGRWPLIVLLPGQGVVAFQYSAIAEELASHGYIVAVVDYFSPDAPPRAYKEDDADAAADDMVRIAIAALKTLKRQPRWATAMRFDQIAAAGHSLGGAAALALPRLDESFRASIDMDGAPFGESLKGVVAPALVLRSKPVYSDADLAKRGRTREQWQKMGEEAARTWDDLTAKSKGAVLRILSVRGTGHFSFSDAPFVMPDAITRFGGQPIEPGRGQKIMAQCLTEFLNGYVRGEVKAQAGKQCSGFQEVMTQEAVRAEE
jgi:dienelactone hydrolase